MKTPESMTRPLDSHHVSSTVQSGSNNRASITWPWPFPRDCSLLTSGRYYLSTLNKQSNFKPISIKDEETGNVQSWSMKSLWRQVHTFLLLQYRVNFKISMFPYTTIFSHAAGFKLVWLLPSGSEVTRLVRSVDDVHQAAEIVYER